MFFAIAISSMFSIGPAVAAYAYWTQGPSPLFLFGVLLFMFSILCAATAGTSTGGALGNLAGMLLAQLASLIRIATTLAVGAGLATLTTWVMENYLERPVGSTAWAIIFAVATLVHTLNVGLYPRLDRIFMQKQHQAIGHQFKQKSQYNAQMHRLAVVRDTPFPVKPTAQEHRMAQQAFGQEQHGLFRPEDN